jgi:hypothetical protein
MQLCLHAVEWWCLDLVHSRLEEHETRSHDLVHSRLEEHETRSHDDHAREKRNEKILSFGVVLQRRDDELVERDEDHHARHSPEQESVRQCPHVRVLLRQDDPPGFGSVQQKRHHRKYGDSKKKTQKEKKKP